jgi:hypothetical protein
MRDPRRARRMRASVLALTVSCSWACADPNPGAPTADAPPTPIAVHGLPRFRADGLDYTSFGSDRVHVAIEKIELRDRKVGVFSVRALSEVDVRGLHARIALAADPGAAGAANDRAAAPFDLRDAVQQPVRHLPIGVLTRVRVDGFESLWTRDAIAQLRITAARAELGGRDRDVELRDVRVEASDGRVLRAEEARWDPDREELIVPGRYEWTSATGVDAGSARAFRADPRAGALRAVPD